MKSEQIRKLFLEFFKKHGHKIIPSASLVPQNDPSVLFTTAGMQPLVPYLLGQPHPLGKRVANVQKSVRTQDIEEIGDSTHLSFFEMMGNWSFGDYFKKEAISWSYELLTSKKEGFGLEPSRLYVTVFEGDENAPKDTESYEIWKSLGIPDERIYFMSSKSNWWSAGNNGPSGPDTEMFYDVTEGGLNLKNKEDFILADKEQKVVEIWNDVFMEYEMKEGSVAGKLSQKNVDTGSGLERMAMVSQKKNSVFETDLFEPIIRKIIDLGKKSDIKAERIIADHFRASVFIVSDGVVPSNTDRGYVLRRLIRRAVRYADKLGIEQTLIGEIVDSITDKYRNFYDFGDEEYIREVILEEENKFRKTLEKGLKYARKIGFFQFDEVDNYSGNITKYGDPRPEDLFELYATYGFPPELAIEELENVIKEKEKLLIEEGGIKYPVFDKKAKSKLINGFDKLMEKHKQLSRTGAGQKFKGGLANHNDKTIKLHTAHHLLLSALQKKFGQEVKQKGSNITEERLRMDFSFNRKITTEELKEIEDLVNEYIKKDYKVTRCEMSRLEAEKLGAQMEFGAKYPDTVSIYFIGPSANSGQSPSANAQDDAISIEFCGGPHVSHTGELASETDLEGNPKGNFKIIKEESVSVGTRRIKAKLE